MGGKSETIFYATKLPHATLFNRLLGYGDDFFVFCYIFKVLNLDIIKEIFRKEFFNSLRFIHLKLIRTLKNKRF